MIRAFLLSLRQMADPVTLRILLQSAALTALLFIAAGFGAYALSGWLLDHYAPLDRVGADEDLLAGLITFIVMAGLFWFAFRVVTLAMLGLFSDSIVARVEALYYPDAAANAAPPGFGASLGIALRSLARLILVNLLALPLYIVLLITGVGTALAFLLINGWLLGRDLDDMVRPRHRHLGPGFGMARLPRWLLGTLATLGFAIPFVNLCAPIIAMAMAVHLSHAKA